MRHESFVGVGMNQTFSEIKTQHNPAYLELEFKNKTRKFAHKLLKTLNFSKLQSKTTLLRLATHISALTVIGVLAALGKSTPTVPITTTNQPNGIGASATVDQNSTLATGAILAESTSSVITPEVKQRSNAASQQVALETAGDDFLAKKQPVVTAGNPTRDITKYKVQNGDTLWSISSNFNITTDTIKWANGLDDENFLKPDQTLTILPVNGVLHTVAAGDTPDSLAQKYQTSASLIDSFNGLGGEALTVGARIIVPDGVIAETPKPAAPTQTTATSQITTSRVPALTFFSGAGNGYSYGYCTWYVASRRSVPGSWGNARTWYYNAQYSGFRVGSAPASGAIAWTGAGYAGHVAYVEKVSGGQVLVSEMNYGGNWGRVTSRWVSAGSFNYIY